jgi:tetratricopeptide (TPR) repeat protein/tRNA A-37 threonylcarbamoyl transferase component Bud32
MQVRGLGPEDVLTVLRVDQRRRWLAGERVDLLSYIFDFPGLREHPEALFELIYNELLIREELGERPDTREYAALFPELAERLRIQLEVRRAFTDDVSDRGPGVPRLEVPAVRKPRLPGYEILGEIGRGGMGVVYRARQFKSNRLVALKMILDGRFASERDLLRFANEAEIVAALEHPNIVPVLEVGQHEGLHYFSMPLLTGGSLATYQPRPVSDTRHAARLVAEVAAAVHHAHERGVLHRDLKPANILLDDEGRPHVTDFGLGKWVRDGHTLTETGAIMGSPAYMAPEQASGDRAAVTTASDVYGLGAILYALLTGRAPFQGAAMHETIARLHGQPPEYPSRINPNVPRPLEQICLVCLEKDPSRRYPTANALAADLRRWLAGEPVVAHPEPLSERTRRWVRRRRTAVAAVAAAMLVSLVGLGVVLAVQSRANRDLREANQRERDQFDLAMEAIKQFHTGVGEDLLLKEPQFEGLRAELLRGAREFFGKLETRLQGQSGGRSRRALAQAYEELAALTDTIGSKTEAHDLFHRGLALRRALAGDRPGDAGPRVDVGRCLLALGALQSQTGHPDQAMAAYDEARALFESVSRSRDSARDLRADCALCDHLTGDLLASSGRNQAALTSYRKARSLREALVRDRPSEVEHRRRLAESDVAIGNRLWRLGQPSEAVAAFRRARTAFEALTREQPATKQFRHDLAQCYNAISYPLYAIGKTDEALSSFEAARAILETLVQENPAVTSYRQQLAYSDSQIGTLLNDTGRPAEALEPYERARASLESLAQANPTVAEIGNDRARCYSQMGNILWAIGRPAEALVSSEKARALREALIAANPKVTEYRSDLSSTLGIIGALKQESGNFSEASTSFRKAVALVEGLPSQTPENHFNLACYRARLAGLAGKPGSQLTTDDGRVESDRAMEHLRRAAASGFRMLSLLSSDHDLDALRSRTDFRVLVADLSFPTDPFAR